MTAYVLRFVDVKAKKLDKRSDEISVEEKERALKKEKESRLFVLIATINTFDMIMTKNETLDGNDAF